MTLPDRVEPHAARKDSYSYVLTWEPSGAYARHVYDGGFGRRQRHEVGNVQPGGENPEDSRYSNGENRENHPWS